MREEFWEAVATAAIEIAELALYLIATTGLSGLGLAAERAGFQRIAAHETLLGLWLVGFGTLLLFVGIVLVGYRELYPFLKERMLKAVY